MRHEPVTIRNFSLWDGAHYVETLTDLERFPHMHKKTCIKLFLTALIITVIYNLGSKLHP